MEITHQFHNEKKPIVIKGAPIYEENDEDSCCSDIYRIRLEAFRTRDINMAEKLKRDFKDSYLTISPVCAVDANIHVQDYIADSISLDSIITLRDELNGIIELYRKENEYNENE